MTLQVEKRCFCTICGSVVIPSFHGDVKRVNSSQIMMDQKQIAKTSGKNGKPDTQVNWGFITPIITHSIEHDMGKLYC